MIVKVTANQREAVTGLGSPFVGLFPSSSGRKHMNLKESGLAVLSAGGVRQSRQRRPAPCPQGAPHQRAQGRVPRAGVSCEPGQHLVFLPGEAGQRL